MTSTLSERDVSFAFQGRPTPRSNNGDSASLHNNKLRQAFLFFNNSGFEVRRHNLQHATANRKCEYCRWRFHSSCIPRNNFDHFFVCCCPKLYFFQNWPYVISFLIHINYISLGIVHTKCTTSDIWKNARIYEYWIQIVVNQATHKNTKCIKLSVFMSHKLIMDPISTAVFRWKLRSR